MTKNKPRKPWLAVLLSLLVTGLGHIYTGRAKKGLILYLSQALVLVSILTIVVLFTNIFTYLIALLIGILYILYCAVDAYRSAKIYKFTYNLKRYNRWYLYIVIFVLANLVIQPATSNLIKENSVKAYKIPSGAMLPTILIGDHILVNHFLYKTSDPERGDIIVFEFPKDPKVDYIKRIIAAGGDSIELRNKKLFINGIEQIETYTEHVTSVIMERESSPRDNFGPVTVPDDTVFVMGDNRDNSYDSRFWGFVEMEKIRGKAISLYWSWDKENMRVRWDRIGQPIK